MCCQPHIFIDQLGVAGYVVNIILTPFTSRYLFLYSLGQLQSQILNICTFGLAISELSVATP